MVPITVVQLVTLSVDLILQSLQMKTAREAQEKDHRVRETIWQTFIPSLDHLSLICLALSASAVIMVQPFADHFSAVPPRPVQDSLTAAQATQVSPQGAEGAEPDQSLRTSDGVSCAGSGQTRVCSSSPVRGGVSGPLDEVALSPVKRQRGVPTLVTSPAFGCTSPGKRSNRSSPLKKGGHSAAKLSPRNKSPLTGKLRTPSPVQRKAGGCSPARTSKSWLGFHRAPSPKMEGEDARAAKSVSVPDLVVYLDGSRLGPPLSLLLCVCQASWSHFSHRPLHFSGLLWKRLKYLLSSCCRRHHHHPRVMN